MEWRRVHQEVAGVTAIATASVVAMIVANLLIYAWLLGISQTAFAMAMYTAVAGIVLSVWAFRRWSYGVFVGRGGIRITDVSGSMQFTMRDIAAIDVRPSVRSARGREPALWIITRDGIAVRTPVVRGRPHLSAYAEEHQAGIHLREPVFDGVVVKLTQAVARAR